MVKKFHISGKGGLLHIGSSLSRTQKRELAPN